MAAAGVVEKACAVVLRSGGDGPELLVFRHPLAGVQLVKGSIEAGEDAAAAAMRELFEEAGLNCHAPGAVLGEDCAVSAGQTWWFVLLDAGDLPERWQHHTADDGGHEFAFFWHGLHKAPSDDWHPDFQRALRAIRRFVKAAR